jgi:hypothetical protein
MTEPTAAPMKKDQKPRHRSPNYPSMGLRLAVAKIDALYTADGLAPSPKSAALKHIGYEKFHSEAARALSALKSYGLIEETVDRVKLTQRGIDIVARPEGDSRRQIAIREAAFGPEIYRELAAQYQPKLPSDASLKADLIAIRKFNPSAVDGFLMDFKDTLEFAGLSDFEVLDSQQQQNKKPEQSVSPQVGDYVQWESNGQLQFQQPKRVRAIAPDGQWAFVDGGETGLPVKELAVVNNQVSEKTGEQKPLPVDPSKPPLKLEKLGSPLSVPKMRSYSWALSGDFNAKMDLFGDAQTEEDIDALADYVEITIKALKRSLKARAQGHSEAEN